MSSPKPGFIRQSFRTASRVVRILDNYANSEELDSAVSLEEDKSLAVARLVAIGYTKAAAESKVAQLSS